MRNLKTSKLLFNSAFLPLIVAALSYLKTSKLLFNYGEALQGKISTKFKNF